MIIDSQALQNALAKIDPDLIDEACETGRSFLFDMHVGSIGYLCYLILSVWCVDDTDGLLCLWSFGSFVFIVYFFDMCTHAPVEGHWQPPNPGMSYEYETPQSVGFPLYI